MAKISAWVQANESCSNIDKTAFTLFMFKDCIDHIVIKQTTIEEVKQTKFLVIISGKKGKLPAHIM